MSETAQFDYFQHCVHCGLCLPKCPTYAELGDENDSPRGRIYLMQAIDSGRIAPSERIQHHLDLCLDCRACETVCPSGVQYGRLIESYRTKINGDQYRGSGLLDRLVRRLVLLVFPYRRRIKWLRRALRLAGALGFALAGPRDYPDGPVEDTWMGDGHAELAAAALGASLRPYRVAGALIAGFLAVAWLALWPAARKQQGDAPGR